MTDRVRHLTITLEEDTRVDDLEPIVSAIQLLRGIAGVEPHVVTGGDHLARQAVRAEVQRKLFEFIVDVFRPRERSESR